MPLSACAVSPDNPCLARLLHAFLSPILGAPFTPVAWHLEHTASTTSLPLRSPPWASAAGEERNVASASAAANTGRDTKADETGDSRASVISMSLHPLRPWRMPSLYRPGRHHPDAGNLCAIPLWQSMQVWPSFMAFWCTGADHSFCLEKSMDLKLWQLRHSCESFAFISRHTFSANCLRCFSNFSGVSMVPRALWNNSFEALILRMIFGNHSFGTWQSGQVARTPVRLLKCTVLVSSWYTLSRISWHEMQNFSVLEISSE